MNIAEKHIAGATKYLPATDATLYSADEGREGEIRAVFSVFNVKDRQGDIVRKEAFRDGEDIPLVWSHDWTEIIGRGKIRVTENEAIFEGKFFINQEDGRKRYETVKEMNELMQWSWGFRILEDGFKILYDEDGMFDGIDIYGTERFEVSPVLVGANQYTRTLDVKSATGTVTLDNNDSVGMWMKSLKTEKPQRKSLYVDQEKDPILRIAEPDDFEHMHEAWPHHDEDGVDNVEQCQKIISALNGANNGIDVPDEWRKALYDHVAEHLRDADLEPPELKSVQEIISQKNNLIAYLAPLAGAKDGNDSSKVLYDEDDARKAKDALSLLGITFDPPKGKRFADEADDVLAGVKSFAARVEELASTRENEGRRLKWIDSDEADELREAAKTLLEAMDRDPSNHEAAAEPSDEPDAEAEVKAEDAEAETKPDESEEAVATRTHSRAYHEHKLREMELGRIMMELDSLENE